MTPYFLLAYNLVPLLCKVAVVCPIAVSVIHPLCMSECTGWVALHYILNPCEGSTEWNGGGKANDWCAVDLVTLFGDSNGRIGLVPFVV